MLSEKSLRKYNRMLGTDFDRAYRRGAEGEGRKMIDGKCVHFRIDFFNRLVTEIPEDHLGAHWSTCFKDRDGWRNVGKESAPGVYAHHMVPVFEAPE